MCRGGRMFAPTKTWRRWHRRPNRNQRRYAVTSALAGSAIPALVLARGHRVDQVPEVPLVVDSKAFDNVVKTKDAVALLKNIRAYSDVEKAKESRHVRAGHGKNRNRRYVQRRGPLLVHSTAEGSKLFQAFRNVPGVETINVTRLNLLQLAPGGHIGRFCIWTKDAFQQLDSIYGTYKKKSAHKKNYQLARPLVANPDLNRLLRSDEVQAVLRAKQTKKTKVHGHRRNPLKNQRFMSKLNPHSKLQRNNTSFVRKNKVALSTKQRAALKAITKKNKPFVKALLAHVTPKAFDKTQENTEA